MPVLDGNVFRVVARFFALHDDIALEATKKIFYTYLNRLIDRKQPDIFNQAIMEFGALMCQPKPNCLACPLQIKCLAYAKQITGRLPIKTKLKAKKKTLLTLYCTRIWK